MRVYLSQKTIGHIQHLNGVWSALGLNTFELEANCIETLGLNPPKVQDLHGRSDKPTFLFTRELHNTESARWYHQFTVTILDHIPKIHQLAVLASLHMLIGGPAFLMFLQDLSSLKSGHSNLAASYIRHRGAMESAQGSRTQLLIPQWA